MEKDQIYICINDSFLAVTSMQTRQYFPPPVLDMLQKTELLTTGLASSYRAESPTNISVEGGTIQTGEN